MRPLLIATIVLACAPGGALWAADRFVNSNTGLNTGDCLSESAACKSITYTLTRAVAGDRIFALPGTFSQPTGETFPLRLKRGVEVIGRDGATATTILNDVSGADSRSIIMHLEGAPESAPTGLSGFTIAGAGLAANRYALAIESFAEIPGAGEPAPYIRDCRILGFADAGILLLTYGFSVNPPPQANSLRARVERNEIRSCGTGIIVATIALDGTTTARDESLVINNVVLGCGTGIILSAEWDTLLSGATGTGTIRTDLRHNTVLDAVGDAMLLRSDDALPGNRAVRPIIANSILARSRGYGVREDRGDGSPRFLEADAEWLAANVLFGNLDGDYHDADTGQAYSGVGGAFGVENIPDMPSRSVLNLAVDPKVSSVTGHLFASSPCIDMATSQFAVLDDIDLETRPAAAASDIGADEMVAPLLRDAFTAIDPLTPARDGVLVSLPPYLQLGAAPFVDPDTGVLSRDAEPLVVYQLPAAIVTPLLMTKAPASDSVTLWY